MVFSYLKNIPFRPFPQVDPQTAWAICLSVCAYCHPTPPVQATLALEWVSPIVIPFPQSLPSFYGKFCSVFPFKCSGAWIGIWITSFRYFWRPVLWGALELLVGVWGDAEAMEAPLASPPSAPHETRGADGSGRGLEQSRYLGGLAQGAAPALWLWRDHLSTAKYCRGPFRTGSRSARWKSCKRKTAERKTAGEGGAWARRAERDAPSSAEHQWGTQAPRRGPAEHQFSPRGCNLSEGNCPTSNRASCARRSRQRWAFQDGSARKRLKANWIISCIRGGSVAGRQSSLLHSILLSSSFPLLGIPRPSKHQRGTNNLLFRCWETGRARSLSQLCPPGPAGSRPLPRKGWSRWPNKYFPSLTSVIVFMCHSSARSDEK